MQYTFEQRKKINDYYREHGLDIHSFTPEALDDFHVYDLDGIDGVDTFHCTPIERNIFNQIRGISVKFLPEYQIGKYYVDFCNPALMLIIEADGKHHKDQIDYDRARQDYLESLGFNVVRFEGWQTFQEYTDFLDDDERFNQDRFGDYRKTSHFYFQELNKDFGTIRYGKSEDMSQIAKDAWKALLNKLNGGQQ